MGQAYLLTGSNLGDRVGYLQQAADAVGRLGFIEAASRLWETAAWGNEAQPSFLNQCLVLQTDLPPSDLLQALLGIETALHRIRTERYAPRTLDIDILFYDDLIIQEPGLTVPHPRIAERRFALQCLADVAPDKLHPKFGKSVQMLLHSCKDPLTVIPYYGL